MRFCFIIEVQGIPKSLSMAVVDQLCEWGYGVDLLASQTSITNLNGSDLFDEIRRKYL
jgi:hypothetical protein